MRPDLPAHAVTSAELDSIRDGSAVTIAGLVIARQRPATAKGVTFMLLEDEHGTLNLIVPPPVHERCRLAVRGEPLVIADGRLERREGVVNVLVHDVRRLERGDLPKAEVRHIEPRRTWSSEAGEDVGRPGGGDAGGQQLRPRAPLAQGGHPALQPLGGSSSRFAACVAREPVAQLLAQLRHRRARLLDRARRCCSP